MCISQRYRSLLFNFIDHYFIYFIYLLHLFNFFFFSVLLVVSSSVSSCTINNTRGNSIFSLYRFVLLSCAIHIRNFSPALRVAIFSLSGRIFLFVCLFLSFFFFRILIIKAVAGDVAYFFLDD